jgi:alpha-D-xyloside xylohydrolase
MIHLAVMIPSILLAAWSTPLGARQATATVRLSFTNTEQQPDQLELSRFLRDGLPLAPSDIQVRRLAEGVTEITSSSPRLATWEFRLKEGFPVYGFGERFDALDQVRRILVNASSDIPGPKGSGTYAPIPFFMDLRGYGLWVDTYAEAVFDLGVTDHDAFIIRFRDTHLRVVFFEGPQFPLILERYTGMVGREIGRAHV